ncbi:MAG: YcjX family protein [Sedimentisphaerales bacterium]|nr:YcjX family protein [Sedimentisphaerales bacterium]MBN2841999.1 YcjX family protein [Sedimentisphaerales bacterium]
MKLYKTSKIAITGIAGGGKTVFLSSLLWHLSEFESSDFALDGQAKIRGWHENNSGHDINDTFPFEKHRDALSRAKDWPKKTTDSYRFSCEYRRSDWKHFYQRLEFTDFPGERIADAAIAAHSGYAQWSDHLFRHYNDNHDYDAAMTTYNQALLGPEPTVEKLLAAYRLSLAGLILGYKPLISPSVFLLDQKGRAIESGTDQAIASARLCGLDNDSQFAPLPAEFRQEHPEIAREFAHYYRYYRKQLVLPLFDELSQAQTLIILVDIPSLLAGGVGRYNDNRQLVLDLIEALQTDSTLGRKLSRILRFWNSSLKKIAFVATKADLVLPADVESGRLMSLLRQMNNRAKNLLPEADIRWFTCSACWSTMPGKAPDSLIGKLRADNPQRNEIEFAVSPLPEAWPKSWQPDDFHYYSVLPTTSQNIQIPPEHLGMDRIFNFMIN